MRDFKPAFHPSAVLAKLQLDTNDLTQIVGGNSAQPVITLTVPVLPPVDTTPLHNGGGGFRPPVLQ